MINSTKKYLFSGFFDAKRICGILLVNATLFVSPLLATTLKEYKDNIKHIKSDFVSIVNDDWKSTEEKIRFEKDVLDEAKKLLPAEDSLEIRGKSVRVNNKWLVDKIENYSNETQNLERKSLILTEIIERLEAIELKAKSLEAKSGNGRSKDENKRKVSEILTREEYQKPTEESESLFQKFLKRLREWWNSLFPKPEIKPSTGVSFGYIAPILQTLLFALVIGAIGFLLYKFLPLLMGRFLDRREAKDGAKIILGERLSADETSKTLFSEAERLAKEGDLKSAIRKGYIALLFELSERRVLGLAKHKTNRDYLHEVKKRVDLHTTMRSLTNNYERCWYGLEKAEFDDWEDFRNRYYEALDNHS